MVFEVRLPFIALICLPLLGMGSCSPSIEEFCQNRFPEFNRRMEHAMISLEPWIGSNELGRRPALDSSESPKPVHPKDRESWEKWARERLDEVQKYIDIAESDPRFASSKKTLSQVANQLVAFYGYTERGQAGLMVATLGRIREQNGKLRKDFCGVSGEQLPP